ncbi:MAG TPA: hypothetical protein VJN92_15545 [Candidatus Acidoferrum sp.]|nr:hypothetical protein [Candidatus Acidoferrum sp.]
MKTLSLACLLVAVPGALWAQDRAHQLASQASKQKSASCPKPNNLTLQQCHDKFPDGCTASTPPHYDAYLDFLKDQDPDPSLAPTRVLTAADFQRLESQLSTGSKAKGKVKAKTGLTSSNHAAFASQFAGLGEGNLYSVVAYLYFVEDTGKGTSCQAAVAETSNCKISAPDSADYHIGLGFNSMLANTVRTSHPQPCTPGFAALEKDSFVAEMTPFPRHSRHPKWSIASVSAHLGEQIKVVGQLMVDNGHFQAKDDCHFTPQKSSCWRSTVWEIHPVTQFYFCNLSAGCDASSPDSVWTSLDQ